MCRRASDSRTKSGTMPRSSAMMRAPLSRKIVMSRSPCASCDELVSRREVLAAVGFADEGAVEADQMIDAEAVVELGAATCPLAQPFIPGPLVHLPPVDRQSPVLPGLRERIGRHADRRVDPELVLARPDVGAVAADHEREVAEDADRGTVAPGAEPLIVGEPLQVLVIADACGQALARGGQRAGIAMAQLGLPVTPVARPVLVVQRAEQRVLVEPPPFALGELAEGPVALGAGALMAIAEHRERLVQRQRLQRAHRRGNPPPAIRGPAPGDRDPPRRARARRRSRGTRAPRATR